MNIQAIQTLTRNEIWNHINEFQLPVKKYPSTVAARAALTAYYEQLPALAAPEPVQISAPEPDAIAQPAPSGAAVAVILLVTIAAFLRVAAICFVVAVMLVAKLAAGLPAAIGKLKALVPSAAGSPSFSRA